MMRGKKINKEFISKFILDCVAGGKIEQEAILLEAFKQLHEIDEKIKEVEKIKKIRCKLLDVIESFKK